MHRTFSATAAVALLCLLPATATLADDKLPEVTTDGLHLVKNTTLRAVWMKPGASLQGYDKVALLACYVAFAKHWQQDYNEEAAGLQDRITDQEMQRIRNELAAEFNKVFTKVLTDGGHELVKTGGTGVLIVRPAIVNLEITAPDLMTAGMEQSYSAGAGQMTLYMELFDGKTGDIIARVIDPEAAGNDFVQVRNSVTNLADADRILKRWAKILSEHLEAVSKASSG